MTYLVKQTFTVSILIMRINLKDITQGKTWVWRLEFYEDEAMQTALDVSGHGFEMWAVDSTGATVIQLDNTDFVSTASNIRTVTISATATAAYLAGVLRYELEVTLPDLTVEGWMGGFITVKSEIVV